MTREKMAERTEAIFRQTGAVIENGHFVYSKPTGHGDHGSVYVNKDRVYTRPHLVFELCQMIAKIAQESEIDVDVVCGPEKGAITLASYTALHLGVRVDTVYAEKANGGMGGYDEIVAGSRVLLVEDVLNSGESIAEAIRAVRNEGGQVPLAIALWNRGGVLAVNVGVAELVSLTNVAFEKWPENQCPLCERNVPVATKLGHGLEFLRRKGTLPPA